MKITIIIFMQLLLLNNINSLEVSFLVNKNSEGEIIQFEKNGIFTHIAISYKNLWLHSSNTNGVELITTQGLKKYGTIYHIIQLGDDFEIPKETLNKFLGLPYDGLFTWNDNAIYCSELIAKILKIKPTPMKFSTNIWPKHYKVNKGQLGISPDEIYNILIQAGYKKKKLCRSIL